MPLTTMTGDGVSLETLDVFAPVPELQSATVRLVLASTPWPYPDAFRPSLSVTVDAATPDRATIEQHGTHAIAEQLTLGLHAVSYDVWRHEARPDGRCLVTVFPAMDTTVIQRQYLVVLGDRLVTLTLQNTAGSHADDVAVFEHAIGTLEVDGVGPAVDPDPATTPRLDEFAQLQGERLEDISHIAATQVWRSDDALPLRVDQLADLAKGRMSKGRAGMDLVAGELCTLDGRLTEAGKFVHRLLKKPTRTLTLEATHGTSRATLHCYLGPEKTAVVATQPPGADVEDAAEFSLQVLPSRTTAIAAVRWLGLAPTWQFDLGNEGRVASADFDARSVDESAPAPADAGGALLRLWGDRWQLTRVISPEAGADLLLLITPTAGTFLVEGAKTDSMTLRPLRGDAALRLLLTLTGFAEA